MQNLSELIAEHKATNYAVVDAQYAMVFDTDWFKARPKPIQDAYRKYPTWHFYTSRDGTAIRRIYGFCEVLKRFARTLLQPL